MLLSNIDNFHPNGSIHIPDFNGKCSILCATNRSSTTRSELDNMTATSSEGCKGKNHHDTAN